ncbi:MAG TPA: RcpC/CpaB family pilus assembly protein [Nocardioides sp.]
MDRRRALLIVAAVIAALGLVLVFLWARNADARADARYDTVDVYKATEAIQLGETFDDALAAGKIRQESVPRGQLLEGYVTEDSADDLDGQLAAMDIAAGEQITTAKFAEEVRTGVVLPVPEGFLAQSVELEDFGRVAGFVGPGDDVAVVVAFPGSPNGLVLVPQAQVLGVGSASPIAPPAGTGEEEAGSDDEVANTVVTLALTAEGAVDLTGAIEADATITLALRGDGVELERGQTVPSVNSITP